MIPSRLRLEHFMCYREQQQLDFEGIHLACLTGDNGNGKSALLDAITWVLWGKARARRDDELITLGELEMWVDLEFQLGGQRYRVWRQRSRRGRGQSDLHLYVWNRTTEDWQLLDDGGISQREAQIVRLLRMEYETFINSAMLLQGRADSFTVKTAADRKRILADILGLDRYDQYEERVKVVLADRKTRLFRLEGELLSIDMELAQRAQAEDALDRARLAVATAAAEMAHWEAERDLLRTRLENRRLQARQLENLRERIARAEQDQVMARSHLAAAEAQLAKMVAVLAQRAEIDAGWRLLEAAQTQLQVWDQRMRQHARFSGEAARARAEVDKARLRIEAEHRGITDRIADLDERVQAGHGIEQQLAEARSQLTRLETCQARRDDIAREVRSIAEREAAIRQELEHIRQTGEEIGEKMLLLGGREEATCPVCGQPLDPPRRSDLVAHMEMEREEQVDLYRANQLELKNLAADRAVLEQEDHSLAADLRSRDTWQRQAGKAERTKSDGQAAAEAKERLLEQTQTLAAALKEGSFALESRRELDRLESELAALDYRSEEHEAISAEVKRLAPFSDRYHRELLPAIDGEGPLRSQHDALMEQIQRREEGLEEDRTSCRSLAEVLKEDSGLEGKLAEANSVFQAAARVERNARQEEGAAMQLLSSLKVLAERREAHRKDESRLNREISIYTELSEAFGKRGLQAMIIESAIPEIETEANLLLARMTEGRMSMRLETQRQKVTGGQAETLEIIISDELGARAYELFSGGEAFRANLALRIAISKLLARRAGTELQTLVIDEGFGTQDARGRSLLVDAINSIQNDFARVLVITHIDELRDLFPARIDVVKTPAGSRVSLVQNQATLSVSTRCDS